MEFNKKIPTNPEKEKRLEQIRILVDRHNFLVEQVTQLEQEFEDKEEKLEIFKTELTKDLEEQKQKLNKNKKIIEEIQKIKKKLSKDFKDIVKKPQLDKVTKRIHEKKYEEYIHRDELHRKL